MTDTSGNYAISNVVTGTYSLMATLEGYSFSPESRMATVPPDATGQDFVGTLLTYSISGKVEHKDGSPFSGVTISATGDHVTGNEAPAIPGPFVEV